MVSWSAHARLLSALKSFSFCSLIFAEVVFQFDPQNVTVLESEGRALLHIHKAGVAAIPLTVMLSTVDYQAEGNE